MLRRRYPCYFKATASKYLHTEGIASKKKDSRHISVSPYSVRWPRRDLNPHERLSPRDFKSRASADSATRPRTQRSPSNQSCGHARTAHGSSEAAGACAGKAARGYTWFAEPPLVTAAIRLMALRNAFALASMLSVDTARPRYDWPSCST